MNEVRDNYRLHPATETAPGAVIFRHNSKSKVGYDMEFYSENMMNGLVSYEEVERVLQGLSDILNSNVLIRAYIASIIILDILALIIISHLIEDEDLRLINIIMNPVIIICFTLTILTCELDNLSDSRTNYRYSCNCIYGSIRGVRWEYKGSSFAEPEVVYLRLDEPERKKEPELILSAYCADCNSENIYKKVPSTALDRHKLRSITFYSSGKYSPQFSSNFYLPEATDNRITLEEVNKILDDICRIRRPYCMSLKLILYAAFTVGLVYTTLFWLELLGSIINPSFYLKYFAIHTLTTFCVLGLLFSSKAYILKTGLRLVQEYIIECDKQFTERGLRWSVGDRFDESVDLHLDDMKEEESEQGDHHVKIDINNDDKVNQSDVDNL